MEVKANRSTGRPEWRDVSIPAMSRLPFGLPLSPDSELLAYFPVAAREWHNGVFIPGEVTSHWWMRGYPFRIYLLYCGSVVVIAQSTAREAPSVIRLLELTEIRSCKAPAYGELSFSCTDKVAAFRYSPAQQRCMGSFLRSVHHNWLQIARTECASITMQPVEPPRQPGNRLRYVLETETLAHEQLLGSYPSLRPPMPRWRTIRPAPVQEQLLALTNLRFILISGKMEARDRAGSAVIRSRPIPDT